MLKFISYSKTTYKKPLSRGFAGLYVMLILALASCTALHQQRSTATSESTHYLTTYTDSSVTHDRSEGFAVYDDSTGVIQSYTDTGRSVHIEFEPPFNTLDNNAVRILQDDGAWYIEPGSNRIKSVTVQSSGISRQQDSSHLTNHTTATSATHDHANISIATTTDSTHADSSAFTEKVVSRAQIWLWVIGLVGLAGLFVSIPWIHGWLSTLPIILKIFKRR